MTDEQKSFEQSRLTRIIGLIKNAEKHFEGAVNRAKSEEKEINANFFDDVRLNFNNDSAMTETAVSIEQQRQMLQERNNSWQQSSRQLATLQKMEKTPYFARIDFKEKGEPTPESIYIGLGSFTDQDDHFLIYDWRAPISSIYYEGKTGAVTYQTPDGPQAVDIFLKRQFLIENGQIKALFDTQETIGDQMLLEVLGEKSDTQMKSIVTTIQREQNQIIRNTDADLLFVQGAAGSGKTSAILQRIAFLLYRYRGNLDSSQVIMFSPNQLFNDYIADVLPELGEQNMIQMTYYQYVARRLPNLTVQSLFDQFETPISEKDGRISRLKESLVFYQAVKRYAAHLEKGDMRFRDLKVGGKVLLSKEKISEVYYRFNENYHLGNRLDATKESLLRSLNHKINHETKADWVTERAENLSDEELRGITVGKDFKTGEAESKYIAKQIVLEAFKPVQKGIQRNRFLSIQAQYVHFMRIVPQLVDLAEFAITAEDWQAHVSDFVANLKAKKMTLSDVTPYLHLYDLMTGKHGERDMRFVFIDEIQDYTPYELAFLKMHFPKARFTLLGDLNQAIFTKESSTNLLQQVQQLFDAQNTKVVQLTRSYRSTQQVTDFTKGLLKGGQKIDAFNRQGDKPNLIVRSTEEALVADVNAQLVKNTADKLTTAIITKTLVQAQALTAKLKASGTKVTLIRSENQRLAAGTLVVPSFLAKGLEFDAIIGWQISASNYAHENQRQLLYTICSRAMHRLTLLATGSMSPLIDNVDPDEYTLIQ
ncbi:RNA polymerase recycling motor HelD [Latilactobacillus graminis]|uniref:AAA family ATPase n=1 Tax=Latilactobacillus graminis TaxID=60519 RepID=A0ABX6C9I5_9LACO|nr:RNA polymerase recycling motor HelD [Latilactobacillus graminis]QFP80267.1 AAA family ATPase [Latilactobacillus graminis]